MLRMSTKATPNCYYGGCCLDAEMTELSIGQQNNYVDRRTDRFSALYSRLAGIPALHAGIELF